MRLDFDRERDFEDLIYLLSALFLTIVRSDRRLLRSVLVRTVKVFGLVTLGSLKWFTAAIQLSKHVPRGGTSPIA